jgi:dihydrofolate reductase
MGPQIQQGRKMSNYVYIACSLDGYIADKDDGLTWLEEIENPTGSDFGYQDFMASIDVVLMGRRTYDMIKDFHPWPYTKPLLVLSRNLEPEELPEGRGKIFRGSIFDALDYCERKGWQQRYIDGGRLIASFLREGLIDEITITRFPILLGNGIPLFHPQDNILRWDLVSNKAEAGLVQSHYIKVD